MGSASWLPPGAQQLLTGSAGNRFRAISLPLSLEGIYFTLSLREKATVRRVTGILFFTRVRGAAEGWRALRGWRWRRSARCVRGAARRWFSLWGTQEQVDRPIRSTCSSRLRESSFSFEGGW